MPPLPQTVIYLRPPNGPALVLREKETLIGRGTFKLSEKGQNVCSRKQACLKLSDASVQLECHGLNPLYFIACQSVNFQATVNTPLSNLYLVRKGDVVELTDGDRFFLAPKECLITVGIKPVVSRQGDSSVKLTSDAGYLTIHNEHSLEYQAVSPKAIQKDQGSANVLPKLLQSNEVAGSSVSGLQVCPIETRDTGRISKPDPCRGAPSNERFKSKAVAENANSVSELHNLQINHCSSNQGDSFKVAIEDPGSGNVSNRDVDGIQENGESFMTKTSPSKERQVVCSPGAALGGLGSLSQAEIGEQCHTMFTEDAVRARNSGEGWGCGPSHNRPEIVCSEDLKSQKDMTSTGSKLLSKLVETDSVVFGDQNNPSSLCNLPVSKYSSPEASLPLEDKSSAILESKRELSPLSRQPYHFGRSDLIPICTGSNVEIHSVQTQVDILEKQLDSEANRNPSPRSSSKMKREIPVESERKHEDAKKMKCSKSSERLEFVDLSAPVTPSNDQVESLSQTVRFGSSQGRNGSVKGMETVIGTTSAIKRENAVKMECSDSSKQLEFVDFSGPENPSHDQVQPLTRTGRIEPSHGNIPDKGMEIVATKSATRREDSMTMKSSDPSKRPEFIDLCAPENPLDDLVQPLSQTGRIGTSRVKGMETVIATTSATKREDAKKMKCSDISKCLEFVDLCAPENPSGDQVQPVSQTGRTVPAHRTGSIKGMENVIATISGYDNLTRTRLINVINMTGAVYTGSLTSSNTHVVCWKFKGAKYDLAKKLGKCIVSHQWFKDCLTAGLRLPEEPYQSSGELEEPLQVEEGFLKIFSSKGESSCAQGNLVSDREQCHRQARFSLEAGMSAAPNLRAAGYSGEPSLSMRSRAEELGKRKRQSVIDLTTSDDIYILDGPTNEIYDNSQTRNISGSGGVNNMETGGSHRPHDNESDDFWNEVIRTCEDEIGTQIAGIASPVVPETRSNILSKRRKAINTGKRPLLIGASSSRDVDRGFHVQSMDQQRELSDGTAESPVNIDREDENMAIGPSSLSGDRDQTVYAQEGIGNVDRLPDFLSRKRKHLSASMSSKIDGNHSRKAPPRALDDLINTQENAAANTAVTSTVQQSPIAVQPVELTLMGRQEDCQHDDCRPNDFPERDQNSDAMVPAPVSDDEIVCVICHSESRPISEGTLICGHKFCYPCIQRWADEAKSKAPTCPLCKVPFDIITFRALSRTGGNGTSIEVLEEKIVEVGPHSGSDTRRTNLTFLRTENLCVTCGSGDTAELLLICINCRERAIHTFCLDPPRPPGSSWFCSRCSQVQSRMQTREAYGRLFGSPGSSRNRMHLVSQGIDNLRQHFELLDARVAELSGQVVMPLSPNLRSPSRRGRGRQHSLYNYLVRHSG